MVLSVILSWFIEAEQTAIIGYYGTRHKPLRFTRLWQKFRATAVIGR